MSTIDYANLLDRLESGALDASVAHNAATAIAIYGGTGLALADPVRFDPREDYWYPPERRFFVAFFASKWPYWPKDHDDALLAFALTVSRHLEAARRRQLLTFRGIDYERGGGLATVMAPLRDALERLPAIADWDALHKKSLGATSASGALQVFLDAIVRSGFADNEKSLGQNVRWFPFLGAQDEADVERRQRFFVAYAHAVMSTNAYKTAGAQYFGPIIGNTPTTIFLDCLKAWRAGKSIDEAPLIALGNDSKEASDRSHTNLVRELWGFLHLHRAPFYNSRAAEYASLVGTDDPEEATRRIGAMTRTFLQDNPRIAARATQGFRRALDGARRSNDRPFAVARRIPESGDTTSFDARVLEDIKRAGRAELLARSDVDQAAMLLHLALDAETYGDSLKATAARTTLATAISMEGEAHAPIAPASFRGSLRAAERVWIYAPGTSAAHWEQDHAAGVASIGWHEVGDLDSYASEDELCTAMEENEEIDGDEKRGARMCWQFANEMKPGDPVLARKGRSVIVGLGVVAGEYRHEAGRTPPNLVPVRWLWKGEHSLEGKHLLAMSTIVESSRRKTLLAELDAALGPRLRGLDDVGEPAPDAKVAPVERYTVALAAADLFMGESWLEHQVALLRRKKNLILQGPPGVGKTYVAKRLAFLLMGEKAADQLELVQFHPSYTYEQFVRGYRPVEGGGFTIEDGPLLRIAERAKGDPDAAYVIVIDEINRGHLGKVLGEAMLLLEADKRAEEWGVRLAYPDPKAGADDEERFFLPPNLYVIGTMNTADRSLAVVDYALRRRFAFVPLEPAFDRPAFRAHLRGLGDSVVDAILGRIGKLNAQICADPSLGHGFQIGHSYFCRASTPDATPADAQAWLDDVLRHEVLPLVEEYWYDAPEAAQTARRHLGLEP